MAQTERDEFRRRFNLERSILEDADKDLETLRQRIAELESRTVTIEPFRSFVTDADLAALHRFAECCDDPESGGHDLEKEQVRRLEAIGALQRSGRISYITGFGDVLISIAAGIKLTMNPNELLMFTSYALAAMDSEPVAYMYDGEDGREYNGHNEFSGGGKGIPLYRHAQPAPERDQVRSAHAEWSQETFGNVGPVGPLKHLSKEALEAAAEPDDLSEWADMQFLLWDAQRRAGITDEQITQAMIEKLAVNKLREWPEPKDGEPRLHIKAQPAPVVTFYRDGIEAAAKWIDQQREAYDSEHGWSDPDTGAFEFGNDAQREYSSTLEELAEGIRSLHPNAGMQPAPVVPDEMLCDFYEVSNWPDLVRELVKHVEQLQDSAKRNVKPWEDTFPETLLPAYIERIKLADEACRAAMLQELQKSAGVSNNCRSNEKVQDLQAGNSPVIPDGSAPMLRRWLAFGRGMQNAGSQLPHNLIAETENMLAAAPQEVK